MRHDVERRAGRGDRFLDDGRGIGRAPDRLGAEERHVGRAEPSRRIRIADEGRGQLTAGCSTEVAALRDSRAEPEEDRFVDERLEPMTVDDGDEQMDRVGAEIDRRADDRPAGGRRRVAGLRRGAALRSACRRWRQPCPG